MTALEEAHVAAHQLRGESTCPLAGPCWTLTYVRVGWVAALDAALAAHDDRLLLADPALAESLAQLRRGEGVVVRRTAADREEP